MWVRKSDQRVPRRNNRVWLFLRGPAVLFVACLLTNVGVLIQGPRQRAGMPWPQGWSEIISHSALFAMVVAAGDCLLQLVLQRNLDPLALSQRLSCATLATGLEHRDGRHKCECGGTFDDFDNWTWIDENEWEGGKR